MARVVRKQKRKTRQIYGVILFVILLAAAGVGLYRFPPSLLDINRIIRLAADKIPVPSADITSAEPVLRGTIYDRRYRELAVSYLLYSLYVRPGEIKDQAGVIRALAEVTGSEPNVIEATLKRSQNSIKLADHLEPSEVEFFLQNPMAGVFLKPVEERFYPENETAASLVGYTGDGIGLAGVEGVYDMLLQHGEFRSGSFPEVDFRDNPVLGRAAVDAVLTVDLDLQREIEKQLGAFLELKQATRGLAILLEPKTGAILALAGLPSFNPNYYWQAADSAGNSLFDAAIMPDLYGNFLARAAAIRKNGELGDPLLPETIAAPGYGLEDGETERFGNLVGLHEGAEKSFPVGRQSSPQDKGISALQFSLTAASLVNGGWKIAPHLLASAFDHALQDQFTRSEEFDTASRRRIVSPSMGIRLRRDLMNGATACTDDVYVYAEATASMISRGAGSEHVIQDMLLAVTPIKSPSVMLLMLTQRDELYPAGKDMVWGTAEMVRLGKTMLPSFLQQVKQGVAGVQPREHDQSNYNRFLISRRVDYKERQENIAVSDMVMPQLTGLSLRKGLQRLNSYNVMVRVEGSGRIVSQNPAPGEALHGIGECVLQLESRI